jgi:hypothetical protein
LDRICNKQAVTDLKHTKLELTLVYMPGLQSEEELKEAIVLAKENGAKGITFFDGAALTAENLKQLKKLRQA